MHLLSKYNYVCYLTDQNKNSLTILTNMISSLAGKAGRNRRASQPQKLLYLQVLLRGYALRRHFLFLLFVARRTTPQTWSAPEISELHRYPQHIVLDCSNSFHGPSHAGTHVSVPHVDVLTLPWSFRRRPAFRRDFPNFEFPFSIFGVYRI